MASIADTSIGYELETTALRFKDPDMKVTDDTPNPKGKVMYVYQTTDGPLQRIPIMELSDETSDLRFTAEVADSRDTFRSEYICGGKSGSVLTSQSGMSANLGFRIVQHISKWNQLPPGVNGFDRIRVQPGGDPTTPTNAGYQLNPVPKVVQKIPEGAVFMLHMTVGMPLAALTLICENSKLYNFFFHYSGAGKLPLQAENDDFSDLFHRYDYQMKDFDLDTMWREGVNPLYGRYTCLGFLIIAQSYVYVAKPEPPENDNSLKLQVPLMPRTDFRTMLEIVTNLMRSETIQFKFRDGLQYILKTKDHTTYQLKDVKWSFSGKKVAVIDPKAPNVNPKLPTAFDWVTNLIDQGRKGQPDLITQGDTYRNSQIGGLGTKTERILARSASAGNTSGNDYLVPIIEFRGPETVPWGALTGQAEDVWKAPPTEIVAYNGIVGRCQLQIYEDVVRKLHDNAFNCEFKDDDYFPKK